MHSKCEAIPKFRYQYVMITSMDVPFVNSPSMLNVTTIPCLKNTVLITHSLDGYSLSIQGTDIEGNVAEPLQVEWNIGKIDIH